MPLTLDTLAILDTIDRRGSFARAVEELERAPSSLTYAVQQLEADLDVLVFDRSGHRARLTPAGQILLDDGRLLLLAAADIQAYRMIAIADTARNLPIRSAGVLQRQARLTVPDLATKLLAQQQGLGVGNVPRWPSSRPPRAA